MKPLAWYDPTTQQVSTDRESFPVGTLLWPLVSLNAESVEVDKLQAELIGLKRGMLDGSINIMADMRAENDMLRNALIGICIKCRSNEWGSDTPRKTILNWMHDTAETAIHTVRYWE